MLSSKTPVGLKLGQALTLVLMTGRSLTATSEVVTDVSRELGDIDAQGLCEPRHARTSYHGCEL